MVVLLVDTDSFVDASAQARSVAQLVGQAASRVESGLSGSSRMAGSDSHGLTWAGSYDDAAKQLLGYVAQLQDAVSSLSTKLAVTGYYYELTELANAGVANPGLSLPSPLPASPRPHVPSAAGGHRRFPNPNPAMQWIAEGIANAIGNAWPDGDTAKLDAASKVWHRLADDLDDVASGVGKLPNALTGVNTPELSRIHDQVDGVRTFTKKLADVCRELGTACNTFSGNIAYVHTQTEITVGITVGVIAATVAAALGLTVFTFGASDAIGVAGVAGETAGAVGTILGYIAEFGATISGAVGGITASAAGLVGISADLAGVIGATVGDITASAVVWGTAGAAENVIVTKITEPDTGDLSAAFDEGFIGGAIGGGAGTALGIGVDRVTDIAWTNSARGGSVNFTRAEFKTSAGSAFFDKSDLDYRAAAQDVPLYPGEYTLDIHGTPQAVQLVGKDGGVLELDAAQFADVVRKSTGWKGEPIRLFSCDTGRESGGFAQQLADELGVPVTAPTAPVWSVSGGSAPIVSDTVWREVDGIWKPFPMRPPTGGWITFEPE